MVLKDIARIFKNIATKFKQLVWSQENVNFENNVIANFRNGIRFEVHRLNVFNLQPFKVREGLTSPLFPVLIGLKLLLTSIDMHKKSK